MIPKFRAWHKEFKLMKPLYGWEEIATGCIYWWLHCIEGTSYRSNWLSDNCELMQSSGLQDISGKDIYEDDICKITSSLNSEYNDIVQIYYFQELCYWGVTKYWGDENGRWSDKLSDCIVDSCKLEIIGNIYENGDLLK